MILSMTAFGRNQIKKEWGVAIWELRSINHRYLELSVRLPEILRDLEQAIRERLTNQLQRGKVECSLKFFPGPLLGSAISINENLLNQLISVAETVTTKLPEKIARLNVIDFLSWEGVVIEEGMDLSPIREDLLGSFELALQDLKEGRKREGEELSKVIRARLQKISHQVTKVKQQLPTILDNQREKIVRQLEALQVTTDKQRLEQEMVYFAQKIDVTEELDRIHSHIAEVSRALEQGGAVGRRLDFMMQELNREANTLSSKSTDADITYAAVEIKVLVEQVREQVQNIE